MTINFYCVLLPVSSGPSHFIIPISVSSLSWETSVASVLSLSPFEVEVNLRPTVSRPVCLGVRLASGAHDQILFSVWRLRVSWCVAPSLTRGRVCNLLYNCFWSLPEQSLLGRSPTKLKTTFYCLIWDSPNLEGQVPVFISPRNRAAQFYPRALGSLLSPLTTRRDAVEVF
jgi:hypothetical protein